MELNLISRRAASVVVVVCILLALMLRLCALGANLPYDVEPDGNVIPEQTKLIQSDAEHREACANWQLYPHLVSELSALIPGRVRSGSSLEEHLAQAASPFVRVRLVVALLSLLGVPATYWLARRFMSREGALLATLLSATSLLTLLLAQQARPHAPAAAMALLAVVAALRMAHKPDWINCSLAGLTIGLSIGTLQSGVASALPVAAAWIFRSREPMHVSSRWLRPAWIVLLASVLAYSLNGHGNTSTTDGKAPVQSFAGLVFYSGAPDPTATRIEGHEIHAESFDGSGFAVVGRTLLSFETVPFVCALVALLLIAKSAVAHRWRHPAARDLLIVAAYVVPYLLMLGMFGRTYERFCLQLIPFVACLAAGTWSYVASRASRSVALACLLLIALPQLGASVVLQRLRAKNDSSTELAAWIEQNVAPEWERVLLVPGVDLPLARTKDALDRDWNAAFGVPWLSYQRDHADEPWDCPKYSLGYLPMLRAPGFAAAMKDPWATARIAEATFLACREPSIDRRLEFADRLSVAFERALEGRSTRECRVPARARDPRKKSTLGYDTPSANTIWIWELLTGLPSVGIPLELYRLPEET